MLYFAFYLKQVRFLSLSMGGLSVTGRHCHVC
jgi:hypothetical protein